MKVGIIGGGIMGMSIGYYLTKKGVEVEIFEAGSNTWGTSWFIHLRRWNEC